MLQEQVFLCWHTHQSEGDAKEIKATSIRSAAKKAVDSWRHENDPELKEMKITVFVKDEARKVHEIVVTQESDHRSPEAFM